VNGLGCCPWIRAAQGTIAFLPSLVHYMWTRTILYFRHTLRRRGDRAGERTRTPSHELAPAHARALTRGEVRLHGRELRAARRGRLKRRTGVGLDGSRRHRRPRRGRNFTTIGGRWHGTTRFEEQSGTCRASSSGPARRVRPIEAAAGGRCAGAPPRRRAHGCSALGGRRRSRDLVAGKRFSAEPILPSVRLLRTREDHEGNVLSARAARRPEADPRQPRQSARPYPRSELFDVCARIPSSSPTLASRPRTA
jgi:hypothetical protein